MKKNIPISDQWKLEGECGKCRRANYCGRDCSALKRRKTKIAQQAYFDFKVLTVPLSLKTSCVSSSFNSCHPSKIINEQL